MYRIHLPTLTVIRHADGEDFDLNAQGEPCRTVGDLRAFVEELHTQGAYDAATRDRLLADVRREHRGGSRTDSGGARDGAGRPRGSTDPRLSLDESRALLYALGDGPAAIATRLGVARQAVGRALKLGLTVRLARRWGLARDPGVTLPDATTP